MSTYIVRHNETGKVLLEITAESLREADLSEANLAGAALYAVEVRDDTKWPNPVAELSNRVASLSGCNLSGSDLSGAVLSDETLVRANFKHANLSKAILVRTTFIGCD